MPVGKPQRYAVALEAVRPGAERFKKGHGVCLISAGAWWRLSASASRGMSATLLEKYVHLIVPGLKFFFRQ